MKLDIKGVESARSGLMSMAANPTGRPRSGMCPAIVRELYVEIREARIAGRQWKDIVQVIKRECGVEFTTSAVVRNFRIVDKEWEQRTGVPALPCTGNNPRGCKGKLKEVRTE